MAVQQNKNPALPVTCAVRTTLEASTLSVEKPLVKFTCVTTYRQKAYTVAVK
jgi:hypothetical protein